MGERIMAFMQVQPLASQELPSPDEVLRMVAPELFHSGRLVDAAVGLKASQAQAERDEIERVLRACHGDRALASQTLGISRTTLWRKLKAAGS
jgi:propionate catabolism operon transcriptional regulator